MPRLRLETVLAAVAVLALPVGCGGHVIDPNDRIVHGVVQYPDGTAASRARVTSDMGTETYADGSGRFSLRVSANRDAELKARDGFDHRAYAETHSGSIVIEAGAPASGHVIVLDQSFPI